MQPPIYVINLPRSQDRAKNMRQRLEALGLCFRFIEAVDGQKLSSEERQRYDPRPRRSIGAADLLDTEIACVLSHRKAWQTLLDEGAPFALILEDDVLLSQDTPRILAELSSIMQQTELLRFCGLRRRSAMGVKPFLENWQLVIHFTGPNGSQGYALSRKGAERLLRCSERFFEPLDTFIDMRWRTGLKTLSLLPWPVTEEPQAAASSTISQARRDLQVKARQSATWRQSLRRNLAKLGRSTGRTLWAVKLFFWGLWLRRRLRNRKNPKS